jgi:hypothetical protein
MRDYVELLRVCMWITRAPALWVIGMICILTGHAAVVRLSNIIHRMCG